MVSLEELEEEEEGELELEDRLDRTEEQRGET